MTRGVANSLSEHVPAQTTKVMIVNEYQVMNQYKGQSRNAKPRVRGERGMENKNEKI